MARYRGQKALYEVISQAKTKPGRLSPGQTGTSATEAPAQEAQVQSEPQVVQDLPGPELVPASPQVRWLRPRAIQFNNGRVELTIPYPIAIALVLAFILIILAAFRLGQRSV